MLADEPDLAMLSDETGAFESFEAAFRSRVHGCISDCACGRIFYNPDEAAWSWEPGELEELAANSRATALSYAAETIEFEGAVYCIDCECWKERARKIVAWLRNHDEEIAAFLTAERKRKMAEAARAPVVDVTVD